MDSAEMEAQGFVSFVQVIYLINVRGDLKFLTLWLAGQERSQDQEVCRS